MNLTNLAPWQTEDSLQLLSPDANTWWFDEQTNLTIQEGATTLTATITNQDAADCCGDANLIDGSKGDKLFIGQLATRQTADTTPVTYRALARVFEPAPFTQTPGGTTTIAGALADVTTAATFSVEIDAPAFDAVVGYTQAAGYPTKLGPNEASARTDLSLDTFVDVQGVPGPAYLGMYTGSVDYALLSLPPGSPHTVATNLGYGELSGWSTSLLVRDSWVARYWLPGTTFARWVFVGTDHTNLLPAGGSQVVAPTLGPVQNPTIESSDLFVSRGDVPLTAHVAWQAPTLGAPTFYRVTFLHLAVEGDTTVATTEATITTSETHVDVPPGALTPGPYAVTIAAVTGDPDAPGRTAYGNDRTTVASALLYFGGAVPTDHTFVFRDLTPGGGVDLDGSGSIDSSLSQALASLVGDAALIANTAAAVARGEALLLADIRASSLSSSEPAWFTTFLGTNPMPAPCIDVADPTCGRHLAGDGQFEVDANTPDFSLLSGAITSGLLTAGPGDLAIQLAINPGRPITLLLSGARIEFTASTANGFMAMIGGGVTTDQIDAVVLPEIEYTMDQRVAGSCTDLASPPACGCATGSDGETAIGLFDSDHDCDVSTAEVAANTLIQSLFAPDLVIDGVPAISYGATVEAVGGSFAVP